MEKVPRPKSREQKIEELEAYDRQLQQRIEELKNPTKKQVSPKSKISREETSTGNRELYRKKRLGRLSKAIEKFMLGATFLLGVDVLGSRTYFEAKHLIQRAQTGEELKKKEDELNKIFGEYDPFHLDPGRDWSNFIQKQVDAVGNLGGGVPEVRRLPKERFGKTELGELDSLDGSIPPKFLSQYLKTMPKGWIDGEVLSISQTEDSHESGYKTESPQSVLATFHRGVSQIVFQKNAAATVGAKAIVETIGHEVAHANDWESDGEMSREERIDLLLKIAKRLMTGNRYHSTYVESIEGYKTGGGKNYARATEYWAEICRQYFKDPTALHAEDFFIVDEQVKKTDPDYNPIVSSNKGAKMILALLNQKLS